MAEPTSTGSRKSRLRLAVVLVAVAVGVVAALAGSAFASSVDESIVDTTAPTGSVTLAPGDSGSITINLTVTGNQVGTATFDVYRDWTLSGGTFHGSNSQTFTVNPRAAQDAATTFSTTGTVSVDSGQTGGPFTLAVGAFNITNSNTTGAKLASGLSSSYIVTLSTPPPADTTPPTVNVSTHNSPTNGWFTTSPQQVDVSAYDASGVTNIQCNIDSGGYADASGQTGTGTSAATPRTGTVSVSGDGSHSVVCRATDGASPPNTGAAAGSVASVTVNIDTTAPSLSLSLSNATGSYTYLNTSTNTVYYNDQSSYSGGFTVTADATDTVSGIAKVNFPNVFTASDGGDDTSSPYSNTYSWTAPENVSGSQTVTAYNGAGLTTTAGFTLTPDTTAPTTSVTGVTNGTTYHLGDTLPTPSCGTATDSGSGVASQDSTPTVTDNRNANGVGSIVYTCSATDNVGNVGSSQATIYVIYNFTGFFQPVNSDPDYCNTVKAGSAIPIKFSLDGYQGMDIIKIGYPTATPGSCTGATTDPISPTETVTAGNSSLSYDATSDQYIYVWKTDKSWTGKAIRFTIMLNDGTTHYARFLFTK